MTTPTLIVAYLGPEGSNTHAAALVAFGAEAASRALLFRAESTITQIFGAVARGSAHHGVVPIENSSEGVVRETMDCLIAGSPVIEREVELGIVHELLVSPGTTLADIEQVVSHPQALAQCRDWLETHLPRAGRIAATSTSAAARDVRGARSKAAIAAPLAGMHYGLDALASNIGDDPHNTTRFWALSLSCPRPSGRDRTTLVFTAPHERGGLRRVLGIFDDAGANLTRIESRPLPSKRWEYAFVVDVEGHQAEPPVQSVILELERQDLLQKVLGSYPRAT